MIEALGKYNKTCKTGVWRTSLDPFLCCYEREATVNDENISKVKLFCGNVFVLTCHI